MQGVQIGFSRPRSWSRRQQGIALIAVTLTVATLGSYGCRPSADAEPPASATGPQESLQNAASATENNVAAAGAPASHLTGGAYAKSETPPFDPVKVNGPVFVDWPAPKFALVVTGLQQGYLEPCGCAGLDRQKGGLARRHTLFRELEERGWPLVALDAGGQIRRYGKQEEIKYQLTLGALQTMQYQAVGLGASDLVLPADILASSKFSDGDGRSCLVSANVALFGVLDGDMTSTFRVLTVDGVRVGITAVIGDKVSKQVANTEIKVLPAAEALAPVVEQLKNAADVRVLLVQSTVEEATELAKKFPVFDVVAVAEGGDEPPRQTISVEGTKTQLVTLGHKGMYAAVLGFYGDSEPRWRYQRVPLDSRFSDSPEMKQLMAAYQGQLQDLGFEGLGLRPMVHPRSTKQGDPRGAFAGAASCAECHPTAHSIWSRTPHAHATESLVSKSVPPRQFDPECLSCHVTGWKPQDYVPFETGFASLEATPQLAGNSCENCHGPAAQHVAAEQARGAELNLALRNQLRAELKLTRATVKQTCEQCHDEDNSPDFDFDRYWPKVEHKGKK